MRGSLRKRIEDMEQAVYAKERLQEVMARAQELVKAMHTATYGKPPTEKAAATSAPPSSQMPA